MKIITLSTKDSFGGAAKVSYRIYQSLREKGVDNLLVVNQKRRVNDDSVFLAQEFHTPVSKLRQIINKYLLKKAEKKRQALWRKYKDREDTVALDLEISLIKNALDKIESDIFHLHWVGESYINFTEFEYKNQPIVWTLHDCFAFTGICTYFDSCNKFEDHCYQCIQLRSNEDKDLSYRVFFQKLERYKKLNFHIVCPSNWLADQVRKSRLLGDRPISVIPNGIDTNFFEPLEKNKAREQLDLPVNKKIFLFGGVSVLADKRKGGDLLLDALHILKQKYTTDDIHLCILGEEHESLDWGMKSQYMGYIEDETLMKNLYCAADLTFLPSRQENLATTIMESMSCSTPVVAFDIGGNSDMVDHLKNGYLAKPYDTKDFANGIIYCLENNNDNQLGFRARQKVIDNFRIEDVAQQYLDLYKSILKK